MVPVVSMVFVDPQNFALVKLAGRVSVVIYVSPCLDVNMDIVLEHLNVFVTLAGVEVFATFVCCSHNFFI